MQTTLFFAVAFHVYLQYWMRSIDSCAPSPHVKRLAASAVPRCTRRQVQQRFPRIRNREQVRSPFFSSILCMVTCVKKFCPVPWVTNGYRYGSIFLVLRARGAGAKQPHQAWEWESTRLPCLVSTLCCSFEVLSQVFDDNIVRGPM